MTIHRICALAAVFVLTGCQMTQTSATAPEPAVTTASRGMALTATISDIEQEVLRLTNIERSKRGLSQLAYDPELTTIAVGFNDHLADRVALDQPYEWHVLANGCEFDCRLKEAGYDFRIAAENFQWERGRSLPSGKALAARMVSKWMASEHHRYNLLHSDFTHNGVVVKRVGDMVFATATYAEPR